MRSAEIGNKITIHYIGTLDNGRIFDSRDEDSPMTLTLGNNEVFPALENEITGMKVGEVKNILIRAEDAYGSRLKENILQADRTLFPADKKLEAGQKLSVQFADGENRVMLVTAVEDKKITLDGNHALAGLDLTFALKLVSIDEQGSADDCLH